MRLKYLIITSVFALMSIVGLVIMAPTDVDVNTNTHFEMTHLYGTPESLSDFSLRSLIRLGVNTYGQVTWRTGDFDLIETTIDPRHGLTSVQLENREMYRYIGGWAFEFNNDDYHIRMRFNEMFFWRNEEPTARLAVLDKMTGKIQNQEVYLPELPRYNAAWLMGLTEIDGDILVVLRNDSGNQVHVFELNPVEMSLSYVATHVLVSGNSWANPMLAGEYVYFESGEDIRDSHRNITLVNLISGERSTRQIEVDGWVSYLTPNGLAIVNIWDGSQEHFILYDTVNGEGQNLLELDFFEAYNDETTWLWMNSIQHTAEHLILTFIGEGGTGNSTFYMIVLDMDSQAIVFVGSIVNRANHNFRNPGNPWHINID